MTVYNDAEIKKLYKKDRRRFLMFTEAYAVKYRIQEGEFWTTKEVLYFAASKGKHEEVERQFRKDFPDAKLINVIYQ